MMRLLKTHTNIQSRFKAAMDELLVAKQAAEQAAEQQAQAQAQAADPSVAKLPSRFVFAEGAGNAAQTAANGNHSLGHPSANQQAHATAGSAGAPPPASAPAMKSCEDMAKSLVSTAAARSARSHAASVAEVDVKPKVPQMQGAEKGTRGETQADATQQPPVAAADYFKMPPAATLSNCEEHVVPDDRRCWFCYERGDMKEEDGGRLVPYSVRFPGGEKAYARWST